MELTMAVQLVISGLTIGCVYSLVGLGFALTLRATELINFAQGEMVMLGAFIGLSVALSTMGPARAGMVMSRQTRAVVNKIASFFADITPSLIS